LDLPVLDGLVIGDPDGHRRASDQSSVDGPGVSWQSLFP
jgi:hypothetical protein